ncbi:Structural maintenance of chromosomes protein 3 [Mortierella sp. GBA39]|nr:Structural maintenance of chromosomes protein 3 [Mortierella sp. GBA39]
MPKTKRNAYLSPKEIQLTLAAPLVPFTHNQHSHPHPPSPSVPLPQPHTLAYTPATQNPVSIFDIPLIFDLICASLSSYDIWSCMMVCTQWKFLSRPHHWRSIRYTYTNVLSRPHDKRQSPIAATMLMLNQLQENVSWVRSLTLDLFCTPLLDMPFSNLVYFHINCKTLNESEYPAEEELKVIELICRNPRLQELTIKRAWRLVQHFDHRVLQFLRTSRLRFLDIGYLEHFKIAMIQDILGNCPDTLEELRLDLTAGYNGFDDPLRLDARAAATPRTLPSLRLLSVSCPRLDTQLEIDVCDLIQSCPSLQKLNLNQLRLQTQMTTSNIFGAITNSCPALTSLDMGRTEIPGIDMLAFIGRCSEIRSLQMYIQPDHLGGVVRSLSRRYSSTLQVLRINTNDLPPNSHGFISTILSHCSALKTLSLDQDLSSSPGVDLKDLLAVKWATTSLERLYLPMRAPVLDKSRFLEEWRRDRCTYLGHGNIEPESTIASFYNQVHLVKQFYEILLAQPNLKSAQLKWRGGWLVIPLEFAEECTNGYLTIEKLSWMTLYLSPLYVVDRLTRAAAKKQEEEDKEAKIKEKLKSCNISVVYVRWPLLLHAEDEEREEVEEEESNSDSLDLISSWRREDQEYSAYKSRRTRTRRRQAQVAKADLDTREESHTASPVDQFMRDDTIAESTKEDEPMEEAVASVPELPVTPVKTRRRLSEPKRAAASPKRAKVKATGAGSSPSSMLPRYSRPMEIPHSAILTQVVWVFDDKYQWWPGKIKPYPPQNNQAKVTRFGSVKPKTITVECVETSILPFEHVSKERFRQSGSISSHVRAFQDAYKEASAEQLKDDDGLPSMDDVFSQLSTLPPTSNSPSLKDTVCQKTTNAVVEYVPDPSLTIPGELLLAQAERGHYYPGRIKSFNSKTNKYKIELATGHYPSLERKRFYTRYQKEFLTCQLGEMAKAEVDENYEDTELESEVVDLYPTLYAIVAGTHDEAGRLKAFLQGGNAKNQLARRVGPGDFTQNQYMLLSRILQSEFLPDLNTTKRIPRLMGHSPSAAGTETGGEGGEGGFSPMKRDGDVTFAYSGIKRVQFVTEVLLPETVTRLTMRRRDLMAKSKKGLSFAEQLCSQAHDELDACQGHSTEIEKIFSKLCFVSRQIKVQIATVESLLRIGRSRLSELWTASKDLQRDLKSVSVRMELALRALKGRQVDSEIQIPHPDNNNNNKRNNNLEGKTPGTASDDVTTNAPPKATVLFDFLDEVSLQRLQQESTERIQRIQSTTQRLQELVIHFGNQRTEFKGYMTNAITLDESALSFAREKMLLQEQQTTTMAELLVSLAKHYDQVVQVLTADIHPTDEELELLRNDTNEVPIVMEELEESLALVQATTEEVGVREHLYTTAYEEAVGFFKKIEALEPDLVELVDTFRLAEGLEDDFNATEKLIGEINSLAIWYEEFHNSYGALMVEIVRRHQAHQNQERIVADFMQKMQASYNDEMSQRAAFSEQHGKFLPVDLCPTFAIIIQGFKSYKNQTVIEPFSGEHNVIVGRNGSGKSNFFAAIRFVLSDAYTSMGREERQSLLHEGSGEATMSAYVEIIFDNSDNRFPTGRDELVMRRTIGLKKDEYSMDKKSATKADVMNMLESAGFSRSNPYYIVPQGRITSLTNAKDNERLQLLKEVAGTRVYETRRQESLKIIAETDSKRRNIEELLTYIEQRLEELEEEKEELKLYQEHDRRRRCLEYTIYSREQKDVTEALEEMEADHRQELDGSNQQQKDLENKEARISRLEAEIVEQRQNIELLQTEKRQLGHELESAIKVKAQIELRIKDHEENVEMSAETKRRNQEELTVIEREIEAKEQELLQVVPEFQNREAEERQLREELEQTDLQRQTLYSKQGRSGQFQSKAQRDEWIRKEMSDIQQAFKVQTAQSTQAESDLQTSRTQLAQATEKIKNVREQEMARRSENEALSAELVTLKAERDKLTDQRKDLWREDAKMDSILNNLREEHRKSERMLGASMDKNTSAGLAAVNHITKTLNLTGVYGPLYELFDVEDEYDTAVNMIAGASLFHVVVDTDETASRALEALNKERAGRVTFMPLNRLNPQASTYPEANDAIPMIKKLNFDPKYSKAFEQVFGRALICRTLEIAATYSRSYNLNGITLDGDRVDRKGALTGGYQDTRNSRLSSIKTIKSYNLKYNAATERGQVVKVEIASLDQRITTLLNRIQLIEVRRKQLADKRDANAAEYRALVKDETALKESVEAKEKTLRDIQADLKTLQTQLQALDDESKSEMVQSLSTAEHRLLGELIAKADNLKERLSVLATERSKLGTRKNILEIILGSNLRPRLDELRDKIEHGNILNDEGLEKRRQDLAAIRKALDEIKGRTQEIDDELERVEKDVADRESSLEKALTEQQDESRQMRKSFKGAEKYVSRRNLLLRKKEDCIKNIRELGVLPEEAFEKYKNTQSQKLLKYIHRVNEELKKYSHVNKKAFEQYSNFTKQRDALLQRRDELDVSEAAIQELIQTLDQRKDEAIERTFKQVAKNFSEVFLKLVPAGRGKLIMQRRIDQTQDGDEEEDDHETSAIDNYTGIAIQVSFNSKMNEGLRMQQLSGGQKSLVALTLIFAIQQCDPAPFYLFDEIDANLDAAHRTAVAAMIHSLSEHAQFITTTFRPEMLANADKFYGVTFQNKVSLVNAITKEDALDFVEQEQAR